MRNHPLVFRIQEPPPKTEALRDYSSCQGYGEMITILDSQDNPSVDPNGCYEKLAESLKEAQNGDYILWSGGDPMSAFFAGLVLAELFDETPSLKWLRWDKRTNGDGSRSKHGYYTPVEF